MLTFLVIFVVATKCLMVEGVDECIGKCPQTDKGIITYLPHNNCNKYCVCVAGQFQEMPCEAGEHWSIEHEICTHPAEAKCEVKDSDATKLGCYGNCPICDWLLPHKNCEKYCKCSNSQASVEDCPKGYYFSSSKQSCVEREESDCYADSKPTTPPPTRPPPTRPPPTRPPPTRPPPTRPPPTRPPPTRPPPTDSRGCIGICPLCNDPKKTDQLPHEDPTKFCKCNWGKPVVFKCPDGLVYIQLEEVCGYPYGGCPDYKSNIDS